MAPRKPQTEEKAKGLIGLKKGKKVAGAAYSVGNYKGKTLNLKKKQLTAAARKAAAVRGGRKVNISNTKYDSSTKKVLGPKGNPLTGKVDLGGGNIAIYKNGVRVRAKTPPTTSKGRGGGGGATKVTPPPKTGKKTASGPLIEAGVRRNYTHNAAMANKAGSEGYGMANTSKTKRGYWATPSERTRRDRAQAAAKRNASKPKTASGKSVPMRIVKNKDGSYRWVKAG
jgi:hypothetical protein